MGNLKQIVEGGITISMVTATLHSNQTVGLCLEDEKGIKYILVYNDAASAIDKLQGCTVNSGNTTGYSVTVSAISGSSPLAGVPVASIPASNYGFLQTSGFKRVKAESIIVSFGNRLLLSSAGVFTQQSFGTGLTNATGMGTANACGYILSTTTAAAGSIDAVFKSGCYPG